MSIKSEHDHPKYHEEEGYEADADRLGWLERHRVDVSSGFNRRAAVIVIHGDGDDTPKLVKGRTIREAIDKAMKL